MQDEPSKMHPIIDSHIHLYPESHIKTLNWTSDLPVGHRLNRACTVKDYLAVTTCAPSLSGFIFVETDRISGLKDQEWGHALDEVSFLSRIARGTPQGDDGFDPADKSVLLGMVPWAPLPAGVAALSRYLDLARERCGGEEVWEKVKGVRYLVQDKPAQTMLQPKFIQGLQWLGTKNLAFDLGVNARSGGLSQLQEACEMLRLVYSNESHVRIVINHLGKPNLRLSQTGTGSNTTEHPDFVEWKKSIQTMASFPDTYMKLSGGFSELLPQEDGSPTSVDELVSHLKPWTEVIFHSFGASRVMFGSDWPVCNAGGPGLDLSWKHWHDVTEAILTTHNLTEDERRMVWGGTAAAAYNIPHAR